MRQAAEQDATWKKLIYMPVQNHRPTELTDKQNRKQHDYKNEKPGFLTNPGGPLSVGISNPTIADGHVMRL
jgi:hypothetical protein